MESLSPPGRDAAGLLASDLLDAWPVLSPEERAEGFRLLAPGEADDLFGALDARETSQLLLALGRTERQLWVRQLAPDDAADLVQAAPEAVRDDLLALLDDPTRKEVVALLAYAEDDAGGLMSPRYVRLRPEMRVDEAIAYLRRQARERVETIYYIYVLDAQQRLLGVVSFRELFAAPAEKTVREVMRTDPVTVPEDLDQESVSRLIAQHDLMAVPVLDAEGRMKGIITIDDIVDVVEEEATEDIQKLGGSAALDAPYLEVSLLEMVRKRGVWLSILFIGELFTASAMGYYEEEIGRAIVLALFIPLVISSGGNSGSQASTLVIRAIALGEVRLRDWWRVLRREVATGLALGTLLGLLGLLRIFLWPARESLYGPHYALVALSVGLALVGIVLWGAVAGSMLPFLLRRLGLDPATASAPFVATLVDVTGLMIYFTVASTVLRGTLL
ncbi:MAG: magnesium transporter [Deltaproteobacteria bacterium]|nr:magnesium transporter [Deltaproteobacteria bacterium]